MKTGILYRLTSPCGHAYIGITCQGLKTRVWRHNRDAQRGKEWPLSRAIRKYGIEAFRQETLVIASMDYLRALEPKAIQKFNTLAPNGYNAGPGGEMINADPSAHTRAQWADPITRAKMMAGIHAAAVRPEARANRRAGAARCRERKSASCKAAWASPERRARQRELCRENWNRPGAREAQSKRMREVLAAKRQRLASA